MFFLWSRKGGVGRTAQCARNTFIPSETSPFALYGGDIAAKQWKAIVILIGVGLALAPIHNRFLTDLATVNGQVLFFLPSFGYVLLASGVGVFVLKYWPQVKECGFGDKKVWMPLLVLVVGMGLSGVVNGNSFQSRLSPLVMGVVLFAVYLVARVVGKDIFRALTPFVIIGSASIIVAGIVNPGQYTGGFITNYCAAAGYLIFGALVYQGRWRYAVMCVALVALFFVGALEAVFIVGVLVCVLVIRRDFSKRLLAWASVGLAVVVTWGILGYLGPLYEGNQNVAVLCGLLTGEVAIDATGVQALTSGRWTPIVDAVQNFSLVGRGYSLSTVGGAVVHNMPLIIMHQVGPFAALSWLFVSIYCLVKTGWKYAWVAILAMGVWDHYLWTQMAPFWWVLVGVSTSSEFKSDWIFRR